MAHDIDAFPDRVYLQSVSSLVDAPPCGQGPLRLRRAEQGPWGIHGAIDVSRFVDHACVGNLARRRLHVHRMGRAPRRVSDSQSCVAATGAQAVA